MITESDNAFSIVAGPHMAPDLPFPSFTLDTARGPVAAISVAPAAEVDTGVPVVLCAGLVGSKEDFLALMPALARAGYRPYAFDYRGHYSAEAQPGGDAQPGGEPQPGG